MNIKKVDCPREAMCKNSKTDVCNLCIRNFNRIHYSDRYEQKQNWLSDKILK